MTMLTDAVLVDRVVAGFEGDFEELYRRHSGSAWRVAQAVTGNSHDSADAVAEAFSRVFQAVKAGRLTDAGAFRSYLMTATRNASLDTLRRSGKAKPTSDDDLDLIALEAATPAEVVDGSADATMIAEAFRNLPERWRSILWLTEVEGVATKEVAEQLGISANGAAQLAVRARAGLRERFLQAHLRGTSDPECRFTVDRLGAYVGGGLSPRDLAKVDQHLAGCEPCREKKAELEDLGTSLRRIVLPLPLALGAIAGKRVATALISASHPVAHGAGAGARIAALAKNPTPRVQRFVAASAAGVFGVGLLAATFSGSTRPRFADLAAPAGATEASSALDLPAPGDVSFDSAPAYRYAVQDADRGIVTNAIGVSSDLPRSAPPAVAPVVTAAPAAPAPVAPPAAAPEAPPAAASPDPVDEVPLPEEPILAVNVGGTSGGESAGLTVEIDSTPEVGVQLGDTIVGAAPEVPEDDGVTVTVDPIGVPETSIGSALTGL